MLQPGKLSCPLVPDIQLKSKERERESERKKEHKGKATSEMVKLRK